MNITGLHEVTKIYEEALNSDVLYSYVDLTLIAKVLPQNVKLFESALAVGKLTLHEIVKQESAVKEKASVFSKYDNYDYRIALREEIEISAADILIYDNKVVVVNIGEEPSAEIIENEDYYNLSKSIFEYLWKILPPVELVD